MKKINEFIDNDDSLQKEFDALVKELYYETAHLSAPHQMMETDSYKKTLSNGSKILPFLINKIIVDKEYRPVYFILCQEISGGIEIPENHRGYAHLKADSFRIWWLENKHKYGE